MSIPAEEIITCRRCRWAGTYDGLSLDEAKGIVQALCPNCEQVLMLNIGRSKIPVRENLITT